MDEKCFLNLLNSCCCECGNKDKNDKTCCNGIYIAKEHGYCQDFIEKNKDGQNV